LSVAAFQALEALAFCSKAVECDASFAAPKPGLLRRGTRWEQQSACGGTFRMRCNTRRRRLQWSA